MFQHVRTRDKADVRGLVFGGSTALLPRFVWFDVSPLA